MKKLEGFWNWWKKDDRYRTLCKALLMALLPVMCCLVACLSQQRGIGEVYLPASEWNDELFYYKQVESIVRYGYPQGYFGFNESHALKLSFAAWSPVLVAPWVVWGLLFGWNLMSPIVCNILLLTLAVFLFVWLVKPTWKQLGVLTMLFCLYTPFVRYMLSGMPEMICFSHLIVFYGLAVNYRKKESAGKLAILFALAGLLTLMRPYMLLFLLLPAYFLIRRSKEKGRIWLGILGAGGICGAVLAVYALIKHYLGAEYFHPLFFTDWITIFFTRGIGAGIHNFFGTLYWKGRDFYGHTLQGFRTGLASGAFFGGYLVTMAILLWQSFADWRKLRRQKKSGEEAGSADIQAVFAAEMHLAFSFVAMLFALLLMYKLTEGSKHLLTFMAVGIFVISLMETKFFKKAVLLGAVFFYFYTYLAVDPYDYQVPFREPERVARVQEWKRIFDLNVKLTEEQVPCYDNVVIWVFDEQSPVTGETMKWQMLYALPDGCGISCCKKEYVLENLASLQSRYIVAQAGADVDEKCLEAGYEELGRDSDLVLYDRYGSGAGSGKQRFQ